MAVIVLHAGMPKAGSSSVQHWLQTSSSTLREKGFTVVVAPPDEQGDIEFAPYEHGPINSSWIIDRGVGRPVEEQQKGIEILVGALSLAAERHGNLVLSGESFAHPFWAQHRPTLAGLQRLSSTHEVHIAYYARPQHTSLEAAWRQWGYRSGVPPSAYVEQRAAQLHHARTQSGVRSLAPGLQFDLRPFRDDLLDRGDVVSDFAQHFLGLETNARGERMNRGLPLEVVNVLAGGPAGVFWDPSYGNERVSRIKRLLADQRLPEDDRIALSRQVLRKYAYERFAAENEELGWDDFVPPPDDPAEIPPLEALDRLWEPQASPAELALIFRALRAAIEESRGA